LPARHRRRSQPGGRGCPLAVAAAVPSRGPCVPACITCSSAGLRFAAQPPGRWRAASDL